MARSAAQFVEDLLAPLHLRAVEIAGARDGQAAVPDKEVVVLVIPHLRGEVMPLVVELVGARVEQVQDRIGDAFLRTVGIVGRRRIRLDGGDHGSVLGHRLRPGLGRVEVGAVGTADIGDVPDGIGTGTVLQGGTGHGVGETLELLGPGRGRRTVGELALGQRIPGRRGEIVRILVPEGGIELHIRSLRLVLGLDILLGDGIEQAGTDDADGGFQAESDRLVAGLIRRRVGIESGFRNVQFRVDQLVLFPVSHRQAALHGGHGQPLEVDLVLVDRREERRDRLGLRHARHLGHIGAVVAVGAVGRMIDHQQVAVAEAGFIVILALAVAVARMAVQAGGAQVRRTETRERGGIDREITLEGSLTQVEGLAEPHLRDGGRLVFVAALGHVVRRAEPAGRIPFIRREIAHRLSDILGIGLAFGLKTCLVFIRIAAQHQKRQTACGNEICDLSHFLRYSYV